MEGQFQSNGEAEIAFPERNVIGAQNGKSLVDGPGFYTGRHIQPDIGEFTYADAYFFLGALIDYLRTSRLNKDESRKKYKYYIPVLTMAQ
jgi:hypothetical protein